MYKRIALFSFLLVSHMIGFGQEPIDQIVPESLNLKYLEHLVKMKIDSVRNEYNCDPLINDSILYIAAAHHAAFMQENRRLTHYEDEEGQFNSPQDRVTFYGAPHYLVGENVIKTNANALVKSKVEKTLFGKGYRFFDTNTYRGLADNIISGWVNSKGHFENIITPEYQITGLAITYEDGQIYACQKFAQVPYVYSFDESDSFFSYSNYQPKPTIASFAGIKRELLDDHRYKWELKHDRPEKCNECLEMIREKPFITLRFEPGRNVFILRVENAAYVDRMTQNNKDGFAVEIVEYNDYACGNPAYYEKPSRRNGQLKTNGRILEPVFRNDLIKGFKKRKKQKEVKFLSYLFGADSVKIKNRFAKYKSAQYTSEYYEITLGRLPKDVNGLWAHNLLYIQDGQICHVDYFTNYCGGLFIDTVTFDFMPFPAESKPTSFKPTASNQYFTVPFEQGKSDYEEDDITPFVKALENVDYSVDSVIIKAYASVEGDSIANIKLAEKRANSILNVWQRNQEKKINAMVETAISWTSFYHKIGGHPKYRHLARLDHPALLKALEDEKTRNDLERILKAERKAEIALYIRLPATEQNIPYLVVDQINVFKQKLESPLQSDRSITAYLDSINRYYTWAHQLVTEGKLDSSTFAAISMPPIFRTDAKLAQKYLIYGYEMYPAFAKNDQWMEIKDELWNELSLLPQKNLSSIFWYDLAYFKTRAIIQKRQYEVDAIQDVLNLFQPLRSFYYEDTIAQANIESLNFNLNMLLLNHVFPENPEAFSKNAEVALNQIGLYYSNNDTVDVELVLNMCRMAVYYNNIFQAQTLAVPYWNEPEVVKYIVPLSYQHPSSEGTFIYYAQLIQLAKELAPETWCNMFMHECGIPFQAFDHEELRTVLCETCEGKNDYLNKLKAGSLN